VKKLPNDHKNGLNNSPTNSIPTKISPKSLGDFLKEKIAQLEKIAQR
jgi:hypothetical protein